MIALPASVGWWIVEVLSAEPGRVMKVGVLFRNKIFEGFRGDLTIIWKTLAVAFADSDSILRRYLNESM